MLLVTIHSPKGQGPGGYSKLNFLEAEPSLVYTVDDIILARTDEQLMPILDVMVRNMHTSVVKSTPQQSGTYYVHVI